MLYIAMGSGAVVSMILAKKAMDCSDNGWSFMFIVVASMCVALALAKMVF